MLWEESAAVDLRPVPGEIWDAQIVFNWLADCRWLQVLLLHLLLAHQVVSRNHLAPCWDSLSKDGDLLCDQRLCGYISCVFLCHAPGGWTKRRVAWQKQTGNLGLPLVGPAMQKSKTCVPRTTSGKNEKLEPGSMKNCARTMWYDVIHTGSPLAKKSNRYDLTSENCWDMLRHARASLCKIRKRHCFDTEDW